MENSNSKISPEGKSEKMPLDKIGLAAYIVFSIAVIIAFTVIAMVLDYNGVEISDTLITCVYAFFGGEIVTCGLVKIFKLKKEDHNCG